MLFGQYMGPKWANLDRMPIYGHTFFGYISANFRPIKLKFHMATQESIIYRLMMRNQRKDLLFKNSKFLVLIWPQKGRGPTLCHKGDRNSGPNQKVCQWYGPSRSHIISKSCFQKFSTWTPPPPYMIGNMLKFVLLKIFVKNEKWKFSLGT